MIDLIINLLTPIFVSMGASAADVGNYIRSVGGYIYAILAALAVMIVVMVAAQFVVKKGTRHVVRWSAGLAWVLVVLLCVNLICYGPLYARVQRHRLRQQRRRLRPRHQHPPVPGQRRLHHER